MQTFKRGMIFVSFFGCCFGISLMASALSTNFWFNSECKQMDGTNSSTLFLTKAKGQINFGLFHGVKMLNWGIGDRIEYFNVKAEYVPHFLSEALWLATVATCSAALLFSVVASIFALVNAATTPIECITGLPGLYIWNGCAALFGLSSVVCWGVQYHLKLRSNVLLVDAEDGWTTEGLQSLGYSYWLVVVAVVIHIANCILVAFGTRTKTPKMLYQLPESKPGNIMLY